ncbi:MAG: 30S ribosomal protein S9 [Lentisphaeria bacterium]|jgi:small subunit ribosomal protein S9
MATKTVEEFWATGRRKEASARVCLRPGSGKVEVNGRPLDAYFATDVLRNYVTQPFQITGLADKFDVVANIAGGGSVGQTFALRHSIARALLLAQPELRPTLKAAGLLTRDARVKERKKYGQPGARKRFQFSKR